MTWYADLGPCDYFSVRTPLTAVGWLGRDHNYPTGELDPATLAKLFQLLEKPWQPGYFMGFHECELCGGLDEWAGPIAVKLSPSGPEVSVGNTNLFVPGDGVVYAAPSMIVHYIDAHQYLPPAEFLAAVRACPPMRSPEYLDALRANRLHLLGLDHP